MIREYHLECRGMGSGVGERERHGAGRGVSESKRHGQSMSIDLI